MKTWCSLLLIAIAAIFTSCHKDDDDNGNLLGAWQVYSSIVSEYDSEGNLQNTWDGGEFYLTYIDVNDEGMHDNYLFSVSSGDNWVFVDDTIVHINDKDFTYHRILLDGVPYIRLDAPNLKYQIVTLSKTRLELKCLDIVSDGHYFKYEIVFNKL